MTKINEDFFDDNNIDTADNEPDYSPYVDNETSMFELIMSGGTEADNVIRQIKKKVYFLQTSPVFENLHIDGIFLNITTDREHEDYPEEFPDSIFMVPVYKETARTELVFGIEARIRFSAILHFTSPKQIVDTVNMLAHYDNDKKNIPNCSWHCYPENMHGLTYPLPDKTTVNGKECNNVWLRGGVMKNYQIIPFYYAYIHDKNMLDRLKCYLKNKIHNKRWKELLAYTPKDNETDE